MDKKQNICEKCAFYEILNEYCILSGEATDEYDSCDDFIAMEELKHLLRLRKNVLEKMGII